MPDERRMTWQELETGDVLIGRGILTYDFVLLRKDGDELTWLNLNDGAVGSKVVASRAPVSQYYDVLRAEVIIQLASKRSL